MKKIKKSPILITFIVVLLIASLGIYREISLREVAKYEKENAMIPLKDYEKVNDKILEKQEIEEKVNNTH